MLESLYIYGMTMLIMVLLGLPYYNTYSLNKDSIVKVKRGHKLVSVFLISLIFGTVFGLRWNVGTDYLAYLRIYIGNQTVIYSKEYLFKLLNDTLYNLNIHYSLYFGIFAFFQIFLLYFSLKKEAFLWIFIPLSLFGGLFFYDWMNGMRQEMASCIMLLGTNFIISKQPFKYFICLILAIGFHTSAILFILIYPIMVKGKSLTPNWKVQECLVASCAGVAVIVGDFFAKFLPILAVLQQMEGDGGYTSIYNEEMLQKFSDISNIGVMFYVFLFINILIIAYSNKIKSFFSGKKIIVYYNLYFWGMIFETLLSANMILIRPFRYFRIYKLIMIAYLLYYLYKNPSWRNSIILGILIILLVGCVGLVCITHPYNFYFDIQEAP